MSDPRLPETDPRLPEAEKEEARLPDDLAQNPDEAAAADQLARRGSEDAQLLAGAAAPEGDVEGEELPPPQTGP